MANILDGLLGRVDDPSLRASLQVEVDRMRSTKDFGLVFEKHMPENVRLYSHPARRGLRVVESFGESDATWLVRRVHDGKVTLIDVLVGQFPASQSGITPAVRQHPYCIVRKGLTVICETNPTTTKRRK